MPLDAITAKLTGLAGPFVLLDDARTSAPAAARLFSRPKSVCVALNYADVPALIKQIDAWTRDGDYAAGFLSYEAGQAFEPCLASEKLPRSPASGKGQQADDWPLGWFARFADCQRIDAEHVAAILPDPAGAALGPPQPCISVEHYHAAIATILDHIAAGDIYQANLTFNTTVKLHGHPLAVYARLRRHARAGYGGIVFTGTHWLLSCSPELFFSVKQGRVMARPMKGTAARHPDPDRDRAATRNLHRDPKQRAENLMIVDLLRNDLSRIAVPGSVQVPSLFRVETYPTIHQMVSDVTATAKSGISPAQILAQLFPCGSITGAPKIRAMQIITATERGPRGAYTGSIGFVAPDGEAAFNVAIRTLALRDGASCANLGLGSGIVADSTATSEWQECLAKGEFIRVAGPDFDLIETMRFDPLEGPLLLERHLARLGDSALTFGFAFDRHALRNMLQHATFRRDTPAKLRLRLSPGGSMAIELGELPATPTAAVRVAVVALPVESSDIRLRHKTSDRSFYDDARRQSGAFEAVLMDPQGRLTEGSFTSLFVERDDRLLTPPLTLGLLPGVLREELIATGRAHEAILTEADLDQPFYIGNAVRGLIRAVKL